LILTAACTTLFGVNNLDDIVGFYTNANDARSSASSRRAPQFPKRQLGP
jgi:hypothetical protein